MPEVTAFDRARALLSRQMQLFQWGSLSWRVVCVLIVGIVVIQIASFSIVVRYKEDDIRSKMLSFMAADVELAHRILRPLRAEARADWLRRLNRGFYTMSLAPRSEELAEVERGRFPPLDSVAKAVAARVDTSPVRWIWVEHGGRSKPILVVPLDEQQSLRVDAEDPIPPPPAWTLAAYMAVLLIVASILSWIAMNQVLLPLHKLSESAYRLGQNFEASPIEERGPSEVRMTARALNAMRERLRRQMEDRTEILAAISHDLQTPITRLRLLAELIDEKSLRRTLVLNLDEMSQLISEGLEYAKSGQLQMERVPIDLNALVRSIAAEMCDGGKQVTVEGEIGRRYVGAFHGIRRALQNLVDNAVKYGVSAHVALEEAAGASLIRIGDRGPGLDPSMLERVFTPFFRIEVSRGRSCGGTGLGLAIARNFVRAHGGEITLRNLPEGGLEALVELRWDDRSAASRNTDVPASRVAST